MSKAIGWGVLIGSIVVIVPALFILCRDEEDTPRLQSMATLKTTSALPSSSPAPFSARSELSAPSAAPLSSPSFPPVAPAPSPSPIDDLVTRQDPIACYVWRDLPKRVREFVRTLSASELAQFLPAAHAAIQRFRQARDEYWLRNRLEDDSAFVSDDSLQRARVRLKQELADLLPKAELSTERK